MLLVIGRVRCDPEKREELVALLERMQNDSRREEGCLRYGFFAAVEDPQSFVAVEEWADMDALAAHLRTPHVGRLIAAIGEMAETERFEIAAHEIARTGPLPLPG